MIVVKDEPEPSDNKESDGELDEGAASVEARENDDIEA